MPVQPKPINQVTYILVRCETDADIEQILGKIETIENDISVRTRLDVVQTSVLDIPEDPDDEPMGPVIYYP